MSMSNFIVVHVAYIHQLRDKYNSIDHEELLLFQYRLSRAPIARVIYILILEFYNHFEITLALVLFSYSIVS